MAVTASTGIAGLHIGGSTIHSWAGIELGEGTAEELVHMVMTRKPEARKNWKEHDAIVLDEVSMVGPGPCNRTLVYFEVYCEWGRGQNSST